MSAHHAQSGDCRKASDRGSERTRPLGRRAFRRARLVTVPAEIPVLTVADASAWSRWLSEHHHARDGVWLVLAKKGSVEPTRLIYDEALEEAIRFGWVDGQLATCGAARRSS